MIQRIIAWMMAFAIIIAPVVGSQQKEKRSEVERLEECGTVLKEVLDMPDDIPSDLLDKAECVIVIPSVIKFAFGFSGNYGKGAMTCRTGEHFTGPWSAPAMMRLEGIGIGFQIGGQATDFIILVMNPRGAKGLLKSKVKLGADASIAGGPKGRDAAAASDFTMRAEMLSYSRSRGLFAGVSLEGSTLRQDNRANENVYGRKTEAESIVRKSGVGVPLSGRAFVTLLNRKSPKNLSDPESLRD
ncbi:MAG TPA: lipid-binding SYLF domain-containing protein [Candidatus Acidoferrum sp.]|nr:lipid-binding SYLF domain-containing protein [Candidatus Acidoferrum sp.]